MKCFICVFLSLFAASPAGAKLTIVTTTTDFADLARQVGGDAVDVHSVMKGPENVHNVMAKPTEMVFLNKADLFVHSGLDAEPWRDNLLKGARNPRVMSGKPGNVDMSAGIELKEVPAGRIDRSMGDVHAFGNPHYTLNPQNAQRMTVTLLKAMSTVDPANAETYKANAKKLVNELADLHKELRRQFEPYAGLRVVTYHKAWEYFADAIDIQIVGVIEPKVATTPSPVDMRRTVELMKQQGVKVVIVETYNSYDQAKTVADLAGATVVTLPDHVKGVDAADTYQKLFRYDVEKLIATAKAAGIEPQSRKAADAR